MQGLGSLTELSEMANLLLPDQYRCRCDFWSVRCPSVPCTYTLILSAPEEEDWWTSLAPSMEGTTVEAPDLGCPCVTVGELTTTWDTLRHHERRHFPNTPNTCLLYTSPSPRD